ncbi:hypothetical protein J3459_013527 [Metarhizium acridum]|nr:hypothetical protein J3459_013527 [Metarhizium acridum]
MRRHVLSEIRQPHVICLKHTFRQGPHPVSIQTHSHSPHSLCHPIFTNSLNNQGAAFKRKTTCYPDVISFLYFLHFLSFFVAIFAGLGFVLDGFLIWSSRGRGMDPLTLVLGDLHEMLGTGNATATFSLSLALGTLAALHFLLQQDF